MLSGKAGQQARLIARSACHQQQRLWSLAHSSKRCRSCHLVVHAKKDDADDEAPSTSYQNSLELTIK